MISFFGFVDFDFVFFTLNSDGSGEHVVGEVFRGFGFVAIENKASFPFAEFSGFGDLLLNLDCGGEGLVEAGHEAVLLFKEFGGEEGLGLFGSELFAGDVFADAKSAIRGAAFVGGVGSFKAFGSAVGAGAVKVGEDAVDHDVHVLLSASDKVFSEVGDLLHEDGAGQFALLHLAEFGFPVAGHGGGDEGLDFHFFEKFDEAESLAGSKQFAGFAGDILLADEAFDDVGAGGGSAETALGHRFAKVVVGEKFARSFHRGKEGGFVVACGWIGLFVFAMDFGDFSVFALFDRDEFVFAGGDTEGASVDREPAEFDEDFSVGAEGVLDVVGLDGGEAFGDLENGVGVENGEEALGDEVVELAFFFREFDNATSGDDGEVIGDLGVVEDALVEADEVLFEGVLGPFGERVRGVAQILGGGLDVGEVVLWEIAGVGPGIGEHLVTLVKGLCELQGAAGGEAEAAGGLTLQGGEVVELGCDLLLGLGLFGDGAGLARAALDDGIGVFLLPDALGTAVGLVFGFLEVEVDPLAFVFTGFDVEGGVDFVVVLADESGDFAFALGEDGEGGSLHAAGGGNVEATVTGAETGQCTSGIEADEPVGLGAALGGVAEVGHVVTFAEFFPRVLNRLGGHRLHPEALDGFLDVADLHDVLENEFTLAAGITGINDKVEVLLFSEGEDVLEAAFRLFDGLQFEFAGDGGEDVEFPRQVLAIGAGGHLEFDEVDRPRR